MDKKTQGKKNRESGARFERKIRADLESKGWIVDRWNNNVEFEKLFYCECSSPVGYSKGKYYCPKHGIIKKEQVVEGIIRNDKNTKLVPAKHKFRGPGIPMSIGTGFPDFIAFRKIEDKTRKNIVTITTKNKFTTQEDCDFSNALKEAREIIGIEVKSNGYLTKEEKEKCIWLLENNVFSKILIAKKGKKRGEIEYKEFKNENI